MVALYVTLRMLWWLALGFYYVFLAMILLAWGFLVGVAWCLTWLADRFVNMTTPPTEG